ncbi:MAG: hypothetical protein ISS93_03110 [Candidatus Aenigmarchaeota archaeon]|nr:hypothetical protein [Candidatus Aenigmarchaeota archaeon]
MELKFVLLAILCLIVSALCGWGAYDTHQYTGLRETLGGIAFSAISLVALLAFATILEHNNIIKLPKCFWILALFMGLLFLTRLLYGTDSWELLAEAGMVITLATAAINAGIPAIDNDEMKQYTIWGISIVVFLLLLLTFRTEGTLRIVTSVVTITFSVTGLLLVRELKRLYQ